MKARPFRRTAAQEREAQRIVLAYKGHDPKHPKLARLARSLAAGAMTPEAQTATLQRRWRELALRGDLDALLAA